MASFARSFKASPYLSPRRRPALPGRTLSNSSEVSLASNTSARSDDGGGPDMVSSAPHTPALPSTEDHDTRDASSVTSSRSSRSRPIAIELPKLAKNHSAPSFTPPPPDPLSARGDLPGGYFPMHEDPVARVHQPHPFNHDSRTARHRTINISDSASHSSMASNTPVASYLPPGFHDSPQPMGKYYPSNWEQRNSHQTHRPSISDSIASMKSESHVPTQPGSPSPLTPEAEARRKMLQYQRDMVAQASLALGGSSKGVNYSGGLSIKDLRFSHGTPQKPSAPKLHPLGSPGPVTPMELETAGGGYLDKGRGSDLRREGRAAAGLGFTANTM